MKREYDFSAAKRGPVISPDPSKTKVSIRLDKDVLEWFCNQVDRAGGGDYEILINNALREFIMRRGEPFEKALRRVTREELRMKSWPR